MSLPSFSFLSSIVEPRLLAALFTCFVAFLLYHHRDGRALGTRSRPDLATVPGQSSLFYLFLPTCLSSLTCSPAGIPLLGNLIHFLRHGDRFLEMLTALRAANKDHSKNLSVTLLGLPSKRFVDITKPSVIRLVFVARGLFEVVSPGAGARS